MNALDGAVRASMIAMLAVDAEEGACGNAPEAAEMLIDAVLTVIVSSVPVADRQALASGLSEHLIRQVLSITQEAQA